MLFFGIGGSIDLMYGLGNLYPESEFLVSGVVTPESNIHAPDENLDLIFFTISPSPTACYHLLTY